MSFIRTKFSSGINSKPSPGSVSPSSSIAFGYDEGIRLSYCTTLGILNEGLTRFEQFCREH